MLRCLRSLRTYPKPPKQLVVSCCFFEHLYLILFVQKNLKWHNYSEINAIKVDKLDVWLCRTSSTMIWPGSSLKDVEMLIQLQQSNMNLHLIPWHRLHRATARQPPKQLPCYSLYTGSDLVIDPVILAGGPETEGPSRPLNCQDAHTPASWDVAEQSSEWKRQNTGEQFQMTQMARAERKRQTFSTWDEHIVTGPAPGPTGKVPISSSLGSWHPTGVRHLPPAE